MKESVRNCQNRQSQEPVGTPTGQNFCRRIRLLAGNDSSSRLRRNFGLTQRFDQDNLMPPSQAGKFLIGPNMHLTTVHVSTDAVGTAGKNKRDC